MTAALPAADRIRGCLLGGALGDALGYQIEFENLDGIVERCGSLAVPAKLGFLRAPIVSDDTQMTLFVAEGLVRAYRGGAVHPTRVVARALDRWYLTQFQHGLPGGRRPWTPDVAVEGGLLAEPRLHHARAPGSTIMGALTTRHETGPSYSALAADNDSKGCGAVMRAAPCGLVAATREDAFAIACDQGAITHAHPGGVLPAGVLAAIVWDLVRGAPLATALDAAMGLLAAERRHADVTALIVRARELAVAGPPSPQALEALGGGWTGDEALAIAVACAVTIEGETPAAVAAALWRAAAHSGDSDSTAAIAGNIIGAALGATAMPFEWIKELELLDVLERTSAELYGVASLAAAFSS
jgi:ADP-ribosyl-[dinitrogen reductase] hydrolase